MAVIKKQHAAGLLKEAIVLDLSDIARQAARIEAAAHAKARQIEQEARARAALMTEHASTEGLAQGRASGLEAGRVEGRRQGRDEAFQEAAEQLEQLRQEWLAAARQWAAHRQAVENEVRLDVLELALRLAEKIVHRTVQLDDAVVVDQVRCALTHALGDHDVTVRIAPEDRPVLEAAMPGLVEDMRRFEHVKLVEDSGIRRGGCLVNFGQGQVDATLDKQLARAVELLLPEPQTPAPDPAPSVGGAHAETAAPAEAAPATNTTVEDLDTTTTPTMHPGSAP